jgi:hypothetical protein
VALVPLAVTVEVIQIGSLGSQERPGSGVPRAFRLSRGMDETVIRFERDLPFEPGRPVAIELNLPDDPQPITGAGVVTLVPPDDEASEGQAGRPRAVVITALEPDARRRLAAYLSERTRSP